MTNVFICVGIIVASELFAAFFFLLLSKWNKQKGAENKIDTRSVLKGLAERIFITFSLISDIPQALTVFAALKIATRIKADHDVSNDFYLLGNIVSITLAIVYSKLIFYFLI